MRPVDYLQDDKLVIFLFHGVVDSHQSLVRNYNRKHIDRNYFQTVLRELKQSGNPLSMDDVIWHHDNNTTFPRKAFCITFDDGFENNYSIAAPILDDMQIPATFYVTTDFIDSNHMSWIDRIEYCIEKCPAAELVLPWGKKRYSFGNPAEKISILQEIRLHAKQDETVDLDALVEDIFRQCSLNPVTESDEPLDRKMNWAQVGFLNAHGRFIVGGHTHRHVNLAFLNQESAKEEIVKSIDLLKAKIAWQPRHYSYPEGLSYCYSDAVIELLKQSGILCSPTAEEGYNTALTDLFRLKRIAVV